MSIKTITKSPVLEEVLWGCAIAQVTWVGQLHLSLLFTCVTSRLHIKTWSKREDATIKMKENVDSSLHCVAGYLPHLNFWFSFCSGSSPSCWDATESTYTFRSAPSSCLTPSAVVGPLEPPTVPCCPQYGPAHLPTTATFMRQRHASARMEGRDHLSNVHKQPRLISDTTF